MKSSRKKVFCSNIEHEIKKIADHHDDNYYETSVAKIMASELANIEVNNIPERISLMITEEWGNLFLGGEEEKGKISRFKEIPLENWHHTYSLDKYTSKMAEIIKTKAIGNNIEFGDIEEDGEYYIISYSFKPNKGMLVRDLIVYVKNLEKELAGHTELALNKGSIDKKVLGDETAFSLNVLLPLFRSMSYQNVQYNHGPHEFGKDIIFSDFDRLSIERTFGVQVKVGDVTGEASSELDRLIGQIDDALKITYPDIYSKQRRCITDLIIAISGRFTGNAPQKICEKVHNKNVRFLDIDKIQELITKYLGTKIE